MKGKEKRHIFCQHLIFTSSVSISFLHLLFTSLVPFNAPDGIVLLCYLNIHEYFMTTKILNTSLSLSLLKCFVSDWIAFFVVFSFGLVCFLCSVWFVFGFSVLDLVFWVQYSLLSLQCFGLSVLVSDSSAFSLQCLFFAF